MNETNQINEINQKTYQIADTTYRLEPLSWQQNKWLGEHIFAGIDLQALDYGAIHDLLREKGPLFMAICLLPEGQTRAQQARQPFSLIEALADVFAGELTGGEVALFGPHFFTSNPPSQMAMLLDGRSLQRMFAAVRAAIEPSPAPGANGSSGVSSSLPTETSPSSPLSLPSSDPLIQIRSSDAASNDAPSTWPSLAGAGSSCPG